jgi:mRNA interferase MazF
VLVVQSNRFNASQIQTILVAAFTSNLHLADAPGNVRVKPSDSGLQKPSVVNVSQLLTVSRQFLTEPAGTLPTAVMNQVADGLRLVLGL